MHAVDTLSRNAFCFVLLLFVRPERFFLFASRFAGDDCGFVILLKSSWSFLILFRT